MAQQQPARRKMQSSASPVTIPDKLYFRIGDVAELCAVPAYVLRFWETEFSQLKPNKGGTGQRLYRRRDVEMALEIKRLLYDEGFTIAGARRLLTERRRQHGSHPDAKPALVEPLEAPSRTAATSKGSVRGSANPMPESGAAKPSSSLPKNNELKKIKALREEMRELLSLLGADHATSKRPVVRPLAPISKKETKKSRLEEPTLF